MQNTLDPYVITREKHNINKTFGCAWPSMKLPRGDHAEVTPIPPQLCSKIEKQKQIISEVQQGLKSAAQHEEYYRSKVRKLEDSIVDRIDALMRCRCRAVSWAVYV